MKRWHWGLAGGVLGAILLVVGLLWRHQTRPEAPAAVPLQKIHVEVLNGCGVDGIADRVGGRLRDLGFDVMTLGNAKTFNYPETLVIDCVGKPDYARQVADKLGTQNLIQQITPDPFRIEEVTVVIGRDYARLPLMQKPAQIR